MEMLKQLKIIGSPAGPRVEGIVEFTPAAATGEGVRPRRGYSVRVGWNADADGLRALYQVLGAEAGRDLRVVRVDGRIDGAGSAASFTAVRRRVIVDWSGDLPTPVLLLDFVPGDLADDQVCGAYATLTVAIDGATWREFRRNVRDAIDRFSL